MRHIFLLFIIIFSCSYIHSQQIASLKDITSDYEAFEYSNVIKLADKLLLQRDSLKKNDLLDVLLMKAVSHYVLSEEDKARKCFIDILKTERSYAIDTEKISPKIVKIFSDVKEEFFQSVPTTDNIEPVKKETSPVNNFPEIIYRYKEEKQSVIRSFILPGWGHLYADKTLKGSILLTGFTANAAGLIYFIIDSGNKQKNYLNERNPSLISSKYSAYNKSYFTRNILIGSLVALYAYTQIDLLLLSPVQVPELNVHLINSADGINLGMSYSF